MVKRSAILISCPGNGQSYLPGAVQDPENVRNYLLSPRGGAWDEEEIQIIRNPNWRAVESILKYSVADYQLVYFSGHGCTEGAQRLLSFSDVAVPDTYLLNSISKQLIIVDACRNYAQPGIWGIPEAYEPYESFLGVSEARLQFDSYIASSPNGKVIVHATHAGQYAYDDSFDLGGAFTTSLLRVAMKITTKAEFTPLFIYQLLPIVTKHLEHKGNRQRPCIVFSKGTLKIPFTLDVPQIVVKQAKKHALEYRKSDDGISESKLLTAALGMFIIILLTWD